MSAIDIENLIHDATRSSTSEDSSVISRLTRAWLMERNSPEIQRYNHNLLEEVNELLHRQMMFVETTDVQDARTNFQLVILQTEMERVKYLIRSYIRTRIAKLDKFIMFVMRDPSMTSRLSALERHYTEKHQAILDRLYHNSFLKDLPDSGNLRKLDDTGAAGMSMIDKPNLHRPVFCKVTRPITKTIKVGPESIELEVQDVFLIRYSAIREQLHDDSVELI